MYAYAIDPTVSMALQATVRHLLADAIGLAHTAGTAGLALLRARGGLSSGWRAAAMADRRSGLMTASWFRARA